MNILILGYGKMGKLSPKWQRKEATVLLPKLILKM